MHRLLIARPSPFARKVRVALIEKGLPFETLMDNPWLADAQAGLHNPLAKVPVLFAADGSTVYDSRVIVEYLEAIAPAPPLLPAAPAERVAARQIEALADGVCDAVVLIVLERARPAAMQSADWITRQRAKVAAGVAAVERQQVGRAREGGDWLVGGALGLADIAVGCMTGYLDVRLPEFDWRAASPQLKALHERLDARESFHTTRPATQPLA